MAEAKDAEFPGEEVEAPFHPAPTWLERGCMLICEIGIVAMAVIVIVEIITRNTNPPKEPPIRGFRLF
jgi:hypothetical protein